VGHPFDAQPGFGADTGDRLFESVQLFLRDDEGEAGPIMSPANAVHLSAAGLMSTIWRIGPEEEKWFLVLLEELAEPLLAGRSISSARFRSPMSRATPGTESSPSAPKNGVPSVSRPRIARPVPVMFSSPGTVPAREDGPKVSPGAALEGGHQIEHVFRESPPPRSPGGRVPRLT